MIEKVAIVVNPAAGHGRAARLWPSILAALEQHDMAGTVFFTDGPGAATSLTSAALQAGAEILLAVGGDGTVNEIVNGFFQGGAPVNPAARLGLIACGTGADFIKTIGLPPGKAAVPHLAGKRAVAVDVGLASFQDLAGNPASRYFLNFADLGLGGETVRRVNRTSKAFGGFISFLWGAVLAIMTYRPRQVEILLDDREPMRQLVGDIVAANGAYFGGGMHIAPAANVSDGFFDVFVLAKASRRELLVDLLPRVYRGTHVDHPKVWWRRGRRLVVRGAEKLLLDIDGELVGTTDVEFQIIPRALNVLVPRAFPDRNSSNT